MIVIATHGTEFIGPCVESVMRYKPPQEHVLVLDGPGYDTGKYVSAVSGYPWHKRWCFMHDSVIVQHESFFLEGFDFDKAPVRAPWMFSMAWDSGEQRDWTETSCGKAPSHGIFGPMFFARCEPMWKVLKKVPAVTTKQQQQGMERGWACLFHNANTPVSQIGWGTPEPFGKNRPYHKHFPQRQ